MPTNVNAGGYVKGFKMEIDAEKLLCLVESRQPIYNYTISDHHNRDVIDKLWAEIGEQLGVEGKYIGVIIFLFLLFVKIQIR